MRGNLSRRTFLATTAAVPASVLARSNAMNSPWTLGIITDEISQDFEQALKFLGSYSLGYCELREIWGKNIMDASKEELARAKKLLREYRVRVSSIASPLYKYDLPELPPPAAKGDVFRAQFTARDTARLLDKAAEISHFFDTPFVRIFSYWRVDDPSKAFPYVRDRLAKAAAFARGHVIVFLLENEHACNVGTGAEMARMVKEINSPHLRGVWDPGNAITLGEAPLPDGYAAVRGIFDHMHVKDVRKDAGKWIWLPVGQGVADYPAVFKILKQENYSGTISLETHYRRADGNRLESTRESLEGLLNILNQT
jgi:sugar phosphate isomerase/epimerase